MFNINHGLRRIWSVLLLMFFLVTGSAVPISYAGSGVGLSPLCDPPLLRGVKVYSDDPLRMDFILNSVDSTSSMQQNTTRLIKYFLAALTIPDTDLWVNLSPYEKERIIPAFFGRTEMGRDLLEQDYILKQVTASAIDPQNTTGREFWAKVYAQMQKRYGTINIPVDTLNKIWIVPASAVVYENNNAAYVVDSKLKVMLETDYFALSNNPTPTGEQGAEGSVFNDILRTIIIPVLEAEVNEGSNFVRLRQVYNALILATWYKQKIKESIIKRAYVDQNKIFGVSTNDPSAAEKIWNNYVKMFRKGAYNYIQEETDAISGEVIPRKYFSGGILFAIVPQILTWAGHTANVVQLPDAAMTVVRTRLNVLRINAVLKTQRGVNWLLEDVLYKYFLSIDENLPGNNINGNEEDLEIVPVPVPGREETLPFGQDKQFGAILLDLDGTLKSGWQRNISKRMLNAVIKLTQKGYKIGIASGREPAGLEEKFIIPMRKLSGDPLIAESLYIFPESGALGSRVSDSRVLIPRQSMDRDDQKVIFGQLVNMPDLTVTWVGPRITVVSSRIGIAVIVDKDRVRAVLKLRQLLVGWGLKKKYNVYDTGTGIDIVPDSVSKGFAAEAFADFLGLQQQDILKIGNMHGIYGNDYPMLRKPGGIGVNSPLATLWLLELMLKREPVKVNSDNGQISDVGGISLTGVHPRLKLKNEGKGLVLNSDSGLLQELQNADGLEPVIVDMREILNPVPAFLGLKNDPG